jgi:pimeloyl-ACP methyl ester carboxylesterase
VLHGIFGAGKNWLSFMRRLVASRPDWQFLLPDLRGHGQSLAAPPPHDLTSAARDLAALDEPAGAAPITAVIGHSFGGKVALAYAAERALDQVWVLDSAPLGGRGPSPAPHPGNRADPEASPTMAVLRALESLGPRFASRGDFTRALEQRGFSSQIAAWLAMSLRRGHDGFELGLDLPAIRSLLASHFRDDWWPELARTDRELYLVVAEKSFVWDAGELARLDELASGNPHCHVHRLPDAGHWVHVDAPEALLELFRLHL